MADKTFISPQALVHDSFRLARQIHESGWRPDMLVVLWRGGTPVGIVVHEFLLYKGVRTNHTVLKAESYAGIEKRSAVRLECPERLLDLVAEGSRVLAIDDIFDTGCTLQCLRDMLAPRRPEMRTATLYYKQGRCLTGPRPDYYVRVTDEWVVFPHELMDLSPDELRRKDPLVAELLGLPAPPTEGRLPRAMHLTLERGAEPWKRNPVWSS